MPKKNKQNKKENKNTEEEIKYAEEDQLYCQVSKNLGQNIYLLYSDEIEKIQAKIASNLKRKLWLKQKDYVLVKEIPNKNFYQIIFVYSLDQIKFLRDTGEIKNFGTPEYEQQIKNLEALSDLQNDDKEVNNSIQKDKYKNDDDHTTLQKKTKYQGFAKKKRQQPLSRSFFKNFTLEYFQKLQNDDSYEKKSEKELQLKFDLKSNETHIVTRYIKDLSDVPSVSSDDHDDQYNFDEQIEDIPTSQYMIQEDEYQKQKQDQVSKVDLKLEEQFENNHKCELNQYINDHQDPQQVEEQISQVQKNNFFENYIITLQKENSTEQIQTNQHFEEINVSFKENLFNFHIQGEQKESLDQQTDYKKEQNCYSDEQDLDQNQQSSNDQSQQQNPIQQTQIDFFENIQSFNVERNSDSETEAFSQEKQYEAISL